VPAEAQHDVVQGAQGDNNEHFGDDDDADDAKHTNELGVNQGANDENNEEHIFQNEEEDCFPHGQ